MKKKILWESLHLDDIEDNTVDEIDDDEDDGDLEDIKGKVLSTPFGFYKIDDKFNPLRQFEFRIGYTNFDIDSEIAEQIENTPGVEALLILTRYRFLIGVGKMFDFRNVRPNIEKQICKNDIDDKIEDSIDIEIKKVDSNKYWAVFMFPNGKFENIGTNELKEYNENITTFRECRDMTNGILIEYTDE